MYLLKILGTLREYAALHPIYLHSAIFSDNVYALYEMISISNKPLCFSSPRCLRLPGVGSVFPPPGSTAAKLGVHMKTQRVYIIECFQKFRLLVSEHKRCLWPLQAKFLNTKTTNSTEQLSAACFTLWKPKFSATS